MTSNLTLGIIISAILIIALTIFLLNEQARLERIAKTAARASNIEVPCDETGIRWSEYEELLSDANKVCHSAEIIRLAKEAEYCFPDAKISTEQKKLYLQPGDAAAWCVSTKFLEEYRDNLFPQCYTDIIQHRTSNQYYFENCVMQTLEQQGILRKEQKSCGKDTGIAIIDKIYCMKQEIAQKYKESLPAISLQPEGACPETHKQLAVKKLTTRAQATTTVQETIQNIKEPPISTGLTITPTKATYTDKTASIEFKIKNNAKTKRTPLIRADTPEEDIKITSIRSEGKIAVLTADNGFSLIIKPQEEKTVRITAEYQDNPKPFTIYLTAEMYETLTPLATINTPYTGNAEEALATQEQPILCSTEQQEDGIRIN